MPSQLFPLRDFRFVFRVQRLIALQGRSVLRSYGLMEKIRVVDQDGDLVEMPHIPPTVNDDGLFAVFDFCQKDKSSICLIKSGKVTEIHIGVASIHFDEAIWALRQATDLKAVELPMELLGGAARISSIDEIQKQRKIMGVNSVIRRAHMEVEIGGPERYGANVQQKYLDLLHERECKICYTSVANVTFNPCGHVAACTPCFQKLPPDGMVSKQCPFCRQSGKPVFLLFP